MESKFVVFVFFFSPIFFFYLFQLFVHFIRLETTQILWKTIKLLLKNI